jgi:REP element-mobilizing transposase RayT
VARRNARPPRSRVAKIGTAHIFAQSPEIPFMTRNHNFSERRTPYHSAHHRNECDIIFLTVCTDKRIPILANDASHQVLRALWQDTSHWRVGRYVIMPDHIHLFAARANRGTASLERWVAWWKRKFSLRVGGVSATWQQSFWDTRMRSESHYHAKWLYVRNNPVRKQLAYSHEDWMYQGEIYVLKA